MNTFGPIDAAADAGMGLSVLRIGGADARGFLQGQLSSDLRLLTRENSQLAALNTPQGRVVSILRLFERTDGIRAVLPQAMIATVVDRLRKYVLRSKVTLSPAEELEVIPFVDDAARQLGLSLPGESAPCSALHAETGNLSALLFCGPVPRALLVGTQADLDVLLRNRQALVPSSWNDWRLAQISAGEPQIHPATSEHFVAQMLNLDLIDGVSFSKGCYTGQEIIVRTHHLGRIKRRMVRAFVTGAAPAPGDKLVADGQPGGEVVEAAARTGTASELLAVVSVALTLPLALAGGAVLRRSPMPYALDASDST